MRTTRHRCWDELRGITTSAGISSDKTELHLGNRESKQWDNFKGIQVKPDWGVHCSPACRAMLDHSSKMEGFHVWGTPFTAILTSARSQNDCETLWYPIWALSHVTEGSQMWKSRTWEENHLTSVRTVWSPPFSSESQFWKPTNSPAVRHSYLCILITCLLGFLNIL